jgi:hypothetical protein
MTIQKRVVGTVCFLGLSVILTACSGGSSGADPKEGAAKKAELSEENREIADERARLSPEDRVLVEAQEWCVVSAKQRLGSMGAPIKLTIQGRPVFICCGGCKRKAEADPDKTIAKVEELKAKNSKP